MRFQRSRLYISAIPPLILGAIVGLLAAVLGAGGGFIIVPAMIYLLRMPTHVVIGTSLFQIIFVTAVVTVLYAVLNQTLDVVLALLLVIGGVIGGQFGANAGQKLKGEQLRLLLAVIVLAVAIRLLVGLLVTPDDLFSLSPLVGRIVMRHALSFTLCVAAPAGSHRRSRPRAERPEQVQSDISTREISIQSNFTGIEIVLFGSVDFSRAPSPDEGPYDVIMTIRGPNRPIVVRKKERIAGLWMNGRVEDLPLGAGLLCRARLAAVPGDRSGRDLAEARHRLRQSRFRQERRGRGRR